MLAQIRRNRFHKAIAAADLDEPPIVVTESGREVLAESARTLRTVSA